MARPPFTFTVHIDWVPTLKKRSGETQCKKKNITRIWVPPIKLLHAKYMIILMPTNMNNSMCLSLVYNEIHCSRVLKLIVRELEYSQWLPYANKPPWSSGCTRVEFAFWHKRSVKLKNKMLKNKMIIGIKLKNKMLYRLAFKSFTGSSPS